MKKHKGPHPKMVKYYNPQHKDKFHAHFVLQDNIKFSIFFEKLSLGKMIEIKKARDDDSNIINVY